MGVIAMTTVTRDQWAELRAAVQAHLDEHAGVLLRFRARAEELFRAMVARQDRPNGTFDRKPNISLRLIASSDPPAKLIALPRFQRSPRGRGQPDGRIIPERVTCELLEERAE